MLSRARGPFLGLLLGLAVATFVVLDRRRAWKVLAVSIAAATALVLALPLVSPPHSPLATVASQTVFGRLAQLSHGKRGDPVWARMRMWSGIVSGWLGQFRGQEVGYLPWYFRLCLSEGDLRNPVGAALIVLKFHPFQR